jgi:Alr-MurF fusion protein
MADLRNVYTTAQIAALTNSQWVNYDGVESAIQHYCFDTRRCWQTTQTIFIALQGSERHGSHFVQNAYDLGIRYFWLQQPIDLAGTIQLISPKPLAALQNLAQHHRQQFSLPIIGITGSNGKTIVKEWLATLLEGSYELAKSPKSYNSQLGVALSLLLLQPEHTIALIEAGISQIGEMATLADMIQPTIGIFTHFGDAHDQGFADRSQKCAEKLKLFSTCDYVIIDQHHNPEAWQYLPASLYDQVIAIRKVPVSAIFEQQLSALPVAQTYWIQSIAGDQASWHFSLTNPRGQSHAFHLALAGQSALENALLAIVAAWHLGVQPAQIASRLLGLYPVSMRTAVITDNPEIVILNDSYNADRASVENAFSMLSNMQASRPKVILTDLEHQGQQQAAVQQAVLQEAIRRFGIEHVVAIGECSTALAPDFPGLSAYPDTESLMRSWNYEHYRHTTVLLKGARRYRLEQLIPLLSLQAHETYLRINLNALQDNYLHIKRHTQVKVMAMLKAAGYGSGAWQLAQSLEEIGVDYLAVAFSSEGIALRHKGVRAPIMVLSPDTTAYPALFRYQLEPVIGQLDDLKRFLSVRDTLIDAGLDNAASLPIHVELETGMGRNGFAFAELPAVVSILESTQSPLPVASIFSHLAAADEPAHDDFTQAQIEQFIAGSATLRTIAPDALLHIANTAGALRFPKARLDMVRLGIGLYGIDPTNDATMALAEVVSLHSVITQLHDYPPGTSIGYGRSTVLNQPARIATVPIGYADGLPRRLSQSPTAMLIRHQRCHLVGRVCMDLLMLDVTALDDVAVGDEVVIFGQQGQAHLSIQELADWADTIPYEILAGLSSRVKRIYVRE